MTAAAPLDALILDATRRAISQATLDAASVFAQLAVALAEFRFEDADADRFPLGQIYSRLERLCDRCDQLGLHFGMEASCGALFLAEDRLGREFSVDEREAAQTAIGWALNWFAGVYKSEGEHKQRVAQIAAARIEARIAAGDEFDGDETEDRAAAEEMLNAAVMPALEAKRAAIRERNRIFFNAARRARAH